MNVPDRNTAWLLGVEVFRHDCYGLVVCTLDLTGDSLGAV